MTLREQPGEFGILSDFALVHRGAALKEAAKATAARPGSGRAAGWRRAAVQVRKEIAQLEAMERLALKRARGG